MHSFCSSCPFERVRANAFHNTLPQAYATSQSTGAMDGGHRATRRDATPACDVSPAHQGARA
eukprot:12790597-Alexandrium_andersonii.AAC.1